MIRRVLATVAVVVALATVVVLVQTEITLSRVNHRLGQVQTSGCRAPEEDSAITDPGCTYDGGVWHRK